MTPGGLPAMFPCMQMIHTLELCYLMHVPVAAFPLLPILEACPNLDSLTIAGVMTLCDKALLADITDSPSSSCTCQAWRSFRLRSFVTRRTTFTYATMEEFLSTCSYLMTFEAHRIYIRPPTLSPKSLLQQSSVYSLPTEPLIRRAVFL